MSDIAISVQNLSKRYIIGHQRNGKDGLRHAIEEAVRNPFNWLLDRKKRLQATREEFWALKDVSFEINQGDVVGIIGKNGAGKSTLLKILSRITEPSSGLIRLRGRVASLLEVGTGFHPELSGRENIFLNGAILGMTKVEIKRKFDEIVAFSEIERFLDTPVKRYSSGMYVRLAFAVAAHLEPEILIVDEVLAVGDAAFQRKCLGKMQDVAAREGRTVIFVSHNMPAITKLCTRALVLKNGKVTHDGEPNALAKSYLAQYTSKVASMDWTLSKKVPGSRVAQLLSARVKTGDEKTCGVFDIRHSILIEAVYQVTESGHVLVPNYHVYNEEGVCVFIAQDLDKTWHNISKAAGIYTTSILIPGNFLAEGNFSIGIALSTYAPMVVHFFEQDALGFEVIDVREGLTARGSYDGVIPGVVRPLLESSTQAQLHGKLTATSV